jgi:hypothetical protein
MMRLGEDEERMSLSIYESRKVGVVIETDTEVCP